jgi:hypothetical protein
MNLKEIVKSELKNIILENESSIVDKGMEDAFKLMKSKLSDIKPADPNVDAKLDQKIKESNLDESLGGLAFGLGVGAPGLLHLLSVGVNGFVKALTLGKVKKNKVGQALGHVSHKWEEMYIKLIGAALKKAYPKTFKDHDINNKNSGLYKTSKKGYALLLLAAAAVSLDGAINANAAITKAFEGGVSAFKGTEFYAILNQLSKEIT